ncbi:hypothetical protein FACS1894166_07940 [Bacilli bacterium]|nr:hypothetical protein FACS1894166_07940 [Bacilli bacterium]
MTNIQQSDQLVRKTIYTDPSKASITWSLTDSPFDSNNVDMFSVPKLETFRNFTTFFGYQGGLNQVKSLTFLNCSNDIIQDNNF